ncbi:thiamine pyrophosphokinase [Piedraia hortae CBS 480.64]|uniref:Thiamine pyrophosphokinase n=1 Tax=Piedraia hortae CBS 480.64 TaxID=1314780 RepID=A0A6A7BYJ6_9PEZI|nr:thiamine pyrophosphokinase [Piedraia hortae CBS 480.64]
MAVLRPGDMFAAESDTTALLILNCPIQGVGMLRKLHANVGYCICADGGANRVYDILMEEYGERGWRDALKVALPNEIHGDLDSIEGMVRERYAALGVRITKDGDTESTDFGKCIDILRERVDGLRDVVVLGSLGGRVDQGLGLVGELLRVAGKVRVWLVTERSLSFVVHPGETTVELGEWKRGSHVGVLPVYGPATLGTHGLKWDVTAWETEMGGKVSSCNMLAADRVVIQVNREVLFTVELAIH